MSDAPAPGLDQAIATLRSASGKRFWRRLDELVERADFCARLGEAFPALAGSAGDWRRRDILKCLGGALALAGLDGCERVPDEDALPFVEQPEGEVPGIARFYATAVEHDGIAQPVIGTTRMARPIKLEGNPDHPACAGATDAFTQAALLGLYDPERSAAPHQLGVVTTWARFDTAMTELRTKLDASGGAGFRLLTGPVGSPTLLRQIAALLRRWPEARWHGGSLLFQPTRRLLLDRAHVVVAFDDDPLGPGPLQTFHARGWSARRRGYQAGDGAAELLVAEPSPTLTGVTATERLVARADRMAALLAALAAQLGLGGTAPALSSPEAAWVARAQRSLAANRGRGLVTVGAQQPPELHRMAAAIDAALGNADVTSTGIATTATPESLPALAEAIRGGGVETLLILEANPVYAAPAGLDWAALIGRVPLAIHAGLHRDETAERCRWHVPTTHALEMWSDGRAADGSPVAIQPLVRPWLEVRSRHALLAGLMGEDADERGIVRRTWADTLDDAGWQRALLSGRIDAAPAAASGSALGFAPLELREKPDGLSVLVRPDPCVWDGSLASNPWLQELPKPLTKITWGNAVHISPALARAHDLANGDMVRLRVGTRSVDGPVWILPGQERDTVLVHLGHGRRRGGRVAQDIGFDAYPLLGATGAVRLEKLGRTEAVATTQQHFAMEGDEFVRFVATAAETLPKPPPQPNFFPPQKSKPAWGMAIDLDLCIGCNACVVACVAENNIPMVGKEQVAMGREMHWLRVDRYYEGSPDEPRHAFQPVPCMHCEDAPCEMGCPVNAAVHSPDGLNLQVYNRCIGTRTCSAYCPYKVRRFNWFDLTAGDPPELRAQRNPEVTVRGRGVMEKCTYCIQRISAARIEAKKADRGIADGEVVTACQAACPTQAIVFGDVSDGGTRVSARKANGRDYDLLPDANTRPRTTYQARIRGGGEA